MDAIGKLLRNRREELNIKQKALADAIGLSSAYINRVEKGESKPAPGFLEKISEQLQLDFVDLYLYSLEDRQLPPRLLNELRRLKAIRPLLEPGMPISRFQKLIRDLSPEDIDSLLVILETISLLIRKRYLDDQTGNTPGFSLENCE
ncbi:helix-turn-helix domain-containing protein [bacterium]|nr:helix-turn-helix domain-containing protein [candidate division CSSED10-310 bacterium]